MRRVPQPDLYEFIGMPRRRKLTVPRRKKKETAAEGEIWEVRAILDEGTNEEGVSAYLIDWAPDKTTGKEYDPEWRPESDVGDQAIADWEALKNSGTQPAINGSDELLPAIPATSNKRRHEELSSSPGGVTHDAKRRRAATVVEVALPAKPDFDTSEFISIPAHSQTTIPDSQEAPDSFPSAAATVGDQELVPRLRSRSPSRSDHGQPSQPPAGDDSAQGQGPSQPPPPPEYIRQDPHQTPSEPSASCPNTTEERAESGGLSFGERQVVTATNSQRSLTLPPNASAPQTQSETAGRPASSPGFLTQPESGFESQPLESSTPATAGTKAVISDSHGKSADSSNQETGGLNSQRSPFALSHSAQVVRPLSSAPEDLRTQSQLETLPSQSVRVIPASSPHQAPRDGSKILSSAIAERRSVPSDAIISDTPARRAHSAPDVSSPRTRNHPESQSAVETGPATDAEPAPAIEQAAIHRQVNSEPACGNSPTRSVSPAPPLASPDQRPAITTPPSEKPAFRMDSSPDIADGDLTGFLRQLHARTVGSTQDTQTSPSNIDQPDRLEHDTGSATLRAATNPEPVDATAISDDATHPSLSDDTHFANPLGLDGASVGGVTQMHEEEHHLPATIAPSQLDMFATEPSFHSTLPPAAQPLFHKDEVEPETVLPGIESRQPSVEPEHESSPSSIAKSDEGHALEHLVTLPMLASTRSLYIDTLRSNKSAIAKYGAFFTTDSASVPDGRLISEVDDIFRRLHDHCDLPQFSGSIPPLSTEAMMKHATGTNSKFSFVFELLKELRETDTRVLILSRPGVTADHLEAIYEAAGFHHVDLDRYNAAEDDTGDLTVIHGTTDMGETLDRQIPAVDVAVLFDRAARQAWQDRVDCAPSVVTLSLVVANSIEHIDLQLPDRLDDLERRNAIGFALAASQSVISDPAQMPEPNELAVLFADHIRDPTHELDWEPRALPSQFFDYFLSSQAIESQRTTTTSLPVGRKRLLDDDDRLSTPTKRARTVGTTTTQTAYPMSDLLRDTLSSYTPRPGGSSQTVEVTIDQLEWMAAKISRLEDELQSRNEIAERLREVIKRNEAELESYRKTVNTLQPKMMQAVSDRGIFEIEAKAASERAAKAEEALEKFKAEARALSEKLAAQTPTDLQEAQTKREALEKKLKSTTNDLDYLRSRYQAASSSAAELAAENNELKAQIKHLEQKSSEATIRLHEINKQNAVEEQLHRVDDLQAIISQREQQLDRAEKELRALKNGRRETRSSSVPRSPRLSVMSPRTRGGGNTSRGTSPAPFDGGSSTPSSAAGHPVPGMTFYQPPGSHPRFSHLRE